MNNVVIPIYDLEVGSGVGTFYQAYDTNIRHIIQHKYILCFSYMLFEPKKLLNDPLYMPKIHHVSLADFPARFKANPFDDYDVVRELHNVLKDAPYRIAYNGKRFDDRVSNSRFAAHGFPIIDTFQCRMIDPLRVMKREFALEKNDLDSACEHFGIEGKTKVTYGDVDVECSQIVNWWHHEPIIIDKKSWELMKLYCNNDVRALYQLYARIRGYDRLHPNMTLDTRKDGCPTCGSTLSKFHAFRKLSSGKVKRRLECLTCGHTYTEREAELIDAYEPTYI